MKDEDEESPENIKDQKLRHTMKTLGIPLTSL
jgi:hypothetical protein